MLLPNGALLFSLLSLLHPLTIPASPSSGLAGLAGLAGVAGLAGPKLAAKAAIKAALVSKKILLVGAAAGVPSAKAVVGISPARRVPRVSNAVRPLDNILGRTRE